MTRQAAFRRALLDPAHPRPDGLLGPANAPAGTRYDVYRNNVTHSLIAALGTAFPLVRKILGPHSFDTLAPIYVRAHPPTSPLMMQYGTDFPTFLQSLPQVSSFGYLPDCARFDLAMRSSYHAADAAPFDTNGFQNLAPDRLMRQTFTLAPATRVLRSSWPLFDIWRFNMTENAPKPLHLPQDVIITRAQFDPLPHLLPPGAAEWLAALKHGQTLGDAVETTLAIVPSFDLAAALTVAFSSGAFCTEPPTC